MTSEQRVDRLCEIWFTAASRNCKLEMIAAFDNHAAEQRHDCARKSKKVIDEYFRTSGHNKMMQGRIENACLNAVEKA